MTKFLNLVLLLLIGTSIYAHYRKNQLPIRNVFPAIARQEPRQAATQRSPFTVTVNGQTHTVTPLFNYEISGLIVSCEFCKMLADYRHDYLNVMDAGLIWGSNLNSDVYSKMKFYTDGVWLRYHTYDHDAWRKFDMNKLSNNHLLCTDPALKEKIKALKRGDLVTIKGCLVSYTLPYGSRGSSTVRTDQGNGACETVWVDALIILEHGNKNWHLIYKISLSVFSGLVLFRVIRFFVGVHTDCK
jgi:hypothetical protein